MEGSVHSNLQRSTQTALLVYRYNVYCVHFFVCSVLSGISRLLEQT